MILVDFLGVSEYVVTASVEDKKCRLSLQFGTGEWVREMEARTRCAVSWARNPGARTGLARAGRNADSDADDIRSLPAA